MSLPPVLALVSGGWHQSSCYRRLLPELQKQKYETRTATLRSVGNAAATIEDDIQGIRRDLLSPLLDERREIVLVLHSLSGLPGGTAAMGMSAGDRKAKGLQGGIIGIICLCAIVTPEGGSAHGHGITAVKYDVSSIQQGHKNWHADCKQEKSGLSFAVTPKENFYSDVKDDLAESLIAQLSGHSRLALMATAPANVYSESFFHQRKAYVRCTRDRTIPIESQDQMLAEMHSKWMIKTLDAGHSPFASRPAETAEVLIELAVGFQKLSKY